MGFYCMARRKTNKEFLLELDKLEDGSEYLVLDNYVKSNVKIRFKHLVCGNIFIFLIMIY